MGPEEACVAVPSPPPRSCPQAPDGEGRAERRYTVTQTTTTVHVSSYTHADVRAMLEAQHGTNYSCLDDDLGAALRAAILDATDVTDRVVADAEQLHSTSEFDVHAAPPLSPTSSSSSQVTGSTHEGLHPRLI